MANTRATPTKVRTTGRGTAETRERLIAAARTAFGEIGYSATRVDDIAERAGTSHGTFYTYFADKRSILLALTEDAAQSLYGTAVAPLFAQGERQGPADALRARMQSFARTYERDWDIVRTWQQASGVHPEVDELRARIRESIIGSVTGLLERDRAGGRLRPGVDPALTAAALVAMVEGFATHRLSMGQPIADPELEALAAMWATAIYSDDASRPEPERAAA